MRPNVPAALSLTLLIAGLLLVYAECLLPGAVIPGVAGGLAIVVAIFALAAQPVTATGLGLLAAALALFIAEAVYRPHGAAGLAGAIVMAAGCVLLVPGPNRIRPVLAITLTLPFALITVVLLTTALRARHNKAVQGSAALIGNFGETRTPLNLGGKVFLDGELWDAQASRPVPAGAKVRILAIQGLTLTVDNGTE